jgi:hypothetical protein
LDTGQQQHCLLPIELANGYGFVAKYAWLAIAAKRTHTSEEAETYYRPQDGWPQASQAGHLWPGYEQRIVCGS